MREENKDKELKAIQNIIEVLGILDESARQRVLDYVFDRLGLQDKQKYSAAPQETPSQPIINHSVGGRGPSIQDIRTLREQKQPSNDSEMAALVAFYLSEVVPEDEKKLFLKKDDVVKYFKQAGFELPKHPNMTLPHARDAGYFDQTVKGEFKLNPVGYNLVVHGLPRGDLATKTKRMVKKVK